MKKVKILITYYKNEAQAFALGLFLCSYCNDKDKSGDICNDGNDRAFLSDRYRRLKATVKVGDVMQAVYERAIDLERIGSEILALHVSQNLLPPIRRHDSA